MTDLGHRWQIRTVPADELPRRFDLGPARPREVGVVFLNGEAWTTEADRERFDTWLVALGVRDAFTATPSPIPPTYTERVEAAALASFVGAGGGGSRDGAAVLAHLLQGEPLPGRWAECTAGWSGCVMGNAHACRVAYPHNFPREWGVASRG